MKNESSKLVRCAIYTRVSSDQGLEQDFNSLDNQREAAEAYIKSQAHEGWRPLPTSYDDGGFSGGTLERPALRRLLADIRARLIDVVVVYKVDRLTRSLADFAKLVELFDQHGVSFVSVTQAFNTTSSMGRLTLNVLLSFAQFEREVTAERIREGIHSKVTRRSHGASRGGIPFTKGPLAYLLKNRVYIGEIIHKGRHYPGEHEPIIDRELFEAVQRELASRAQARGQHRINDASLLTGRIFDDRGNRMTPSTGKKGSARYRYYVSAALLQGRREDAGSVPRVPAPDVEAAVIGALRQIADGAARTGQGQDGAGTDRDLVDAHIDKVVIRRDAVEITKRNIGSDTPVVVRWSSAPAYQRREIIVPPGADRSEERPIRSESRARLVEGIAKARLWLDELITGLTSDTSEIARREGCSERSIRMTLSLAFLAPTIVRAAVDGTLPQGHGVSTLVELPADWQKQMRIMAPTW